MSASSSSIGFSAAVVSCSASWMKLLSHYVEFSSPSAGENVSVFSFSSSSMTVTLGCPSYVVSSTTDPDYFRHEMRAEI
jgi:hypothetical protein